MAKQQVTPHQQQVFRTRLAHVDQGWDLIRRDLLVHGHRPTRLHAVASLVLVAVGLAFLIATVSIYHAERALYIQPLVFGFVFPLCGVYYAVVYWTRAAKYRVAERAYQVRRQQVRIEDCPRQPDRTGSNDQLPAEEEIAGHYLLGDE